MIRIELPTLIGKLNAQTKLALEQAASVCISRQNSEVTFEHLLFSLLENPLSDVRVLIKQAGLDHDVLKQSIGAVMARSKDGHETYPAFSPLLVELLQDAWLLSSIELNETELRSGAIFLAALLHSDRYLEFSLHDLFKSFNCETLRKNFSILTSGSTESPSQHDTPKSVSVSVLNNSTTALSRFCCNFTEKARKGELDPVICRDAEINLMIDILCRRRKNNPIVVGDAGVGKSAVVEGLALRIVENKVPESLRNVELMSLDLGRLQAGASVKGEFEKRLKGLIDEVKASSTPIILFIDEAHTLIGAGNQDGNDAANLLKPALARGELCTIAATTWKEYKKYFEKDPALNRRFQLVKLDEPSVEQAVDILRGLHQVYEKAHKVLISDEALRAAAELSARYVSGRQLPDKAIDVLDTACARIAINLSSPPRRIGELENICYQRQLEINMLNRQKKLAQSIDEERLEELLKLEVDTRALIKKLHGAWEVQRELVEKVIVIRQAILGDSDIISTNADIEANSDNLAYEKVSIELQKNKEEQENELREQLKSLYAELAAIPHSEVLMHPEVDAEQIAEVIADWTGVPVDQMNTDELTKITNLPQLLGATIKGQDTALATIHRHMLTSRADLRRPGRPKGAFLLVGPSGVGKTETVLQLAEKLYGGRQFLTTINMSEYQEKHTVSRLIGSPPGYVGFGEGGVLTEAIRKMPYSIVLLDEVEKAHPDVLNLFYQAFDKGEMADGEGRLIDCQNIVFFLTSNLAYQSIVEHCAETGSIEDEIYPELAAFFKPALLARMEVVVYRPLGESILKQIIFGKLSRLEKLFMSRYKAEVKIDDSLIDEILRRSTRSENGARMLEAIIEGQMLPAISLALLNKLVAREDVHRIYLTVKDGEFFGEVE